MIIAAVISFFGCYIGIALAIALFRIVFPIIIVHERECHIIKFMGKIACRYDEPGWHMLGQQLGYVKAMAFCMMGEDIVIDTRLDQCYLRSLPVNSEEGAPMGIGVWYEMMVSDPVKFRFENSDPEGSLKANVSNATVRCLSNLTLADMMEDRHTMSRSVRQEVSPHSSEWGYKLGSVYIRKVHFRDRRMVGQIQEKVVNRLRQVTAAILQDGKNRVNVISSEADRKAAIEFARASAVRPEIVGRALEDISKDSEVAEAMFEVLETEKLVKSGARITLVPVGCGKSAADSAVFSEALNGGAAALSGPAANSAFAPNRGGRQNASADNAMQSGQSFDFDL